MESNGIAVADNGERAVPAGSRFGFLLAALLLAGVTAGSVWVVGSRPVDGRTESLEADLSTVLSDRFSEVEPSFGAVVDATGRLESYRVTVSQRTPSIRLETETLQVGANSESLVDFGGVESVVRLVDGRLYELQDGIWYLKPAPARALVPAVQLPDLTTALRTLPAVVVERTNEAITLRIDCGTMDRPDIDEVVRGLCDDRIVTTAVVSLETGLLRSVQGVGHIEVGPGRYEDGLISIDIEQAGEVDRIGAPESFDSTRADCVGDQLGSRDYLEMSIRLDDNTTAENGALFGGCGFHLYPPGKDFGQLEVDDTPTAEAMAISILAAAEADEEITVSESEAECVAQKLLESELSNTTLFGLIDNFDSPEVEIEDADIVGEVVAAAASTCVQS